MTETSAATASHIDVGGHATYHEVVGAGEPLVLLHGGLCSIETMRPQIAGLASSFRVHAPERPAHGRTADREGPMTYTGGVRDTLGYLDSVGIDRAHVVGYSDGAIIGLMLAIEHPDRVRTLVSISGNLDTTAYVPHDESQPGPEPGSSGDVIGRLKTEYAALSPDGPGHLDAMLEKLGLMWRDEPNIDPGELSRITAPTLVMAGDHDAVRTEHTIAIAAGIPGAQLCIVPGTTHMLMEEKPELVTELVRAFLIEHSLVEQSLVNQRAD
jgi:pimeloyl-ACP methyl ester carboxylesterase